MADSPHLARALQTLLAALPPDTVQALIAGGGQADSQENGSSQAPPSSQVPPPPSQVPPPPSQMPPPPSQGLSSLEATLHRPVQAYTSQRALASGLPFSAGGHPSPFAASSHVSPRSFGFPESISSQAINQANDARRASAARTLPRPVNVPPRASRRTRGTAYTTPSLPFAVQGAVRQCLVQPARNGQEPLIQVLVRVYPRKPDNTSDDLFLFRHLSASFDASLEEFALIYRYQLPHHTTIYDLTEQVWGDMMGGSLGYYAPQPREGTRSRLRPHETLPLVACRFVNRATPRNHDQQVRLEPTPLRFDFTLADFMKDRRNYVPDKAFTVPGHVPIFFVTRDMPVALTASFEGEAPRRHTCISTRLWRLYPRDELNVAIDDGLAESSEDESDADEAAVSSLLTVRTRAATADFRAAQQQTIENSTATSSDVWALPPSIWGLDWIPDHVPVDPQFSRENFSRTVAVAALRGRSMPTVALQATTLAGLAQQLWELCRSCWNTGDYKDLFTQNRSFRIVGDLGDTISFGDGLGREAIQHLLITQVQGNHGRFFRDRLDGYSTIACSQPLMNAAIISQERRDEMGQLGVFMGYCISQGIAPLPIGPLVLLLALSRYDMRELTVDRVAIYHPDLQRTLRTFLEIGHAGNIAEYTDIVTLLASLCDQQAASLATRDHQSHQAIAALLLYNAIMGPEPPSHPEISCWTRGLRMACTNGFSLAQVIHSFDGGPIAFLESLYKTQVESFDDLEPLLHFGNPPSALVAGLTANFPNDTPESLFRGFLSRTGIPCPRLFDELRVSLNGTVPLDEDTIASPSFRPRMFLRAITGLDRLQVGMHRMLVCFVGEDNLGYADTPVLRQSMARQGIISFSTCARHALIPAEHFSTIASTSFDESAEPATFYDAIDHWLLMAILTSIANHTKA